MNYLGAGYGLGFPFMSPAAGMFLFVVIVWSLVWKGFALWRAAKRGEKIWFVIFLLVNSVGILEIIYLFLISGAKMSDLMPPSARKGKGTID